MFNLCESVAKRERIMVLKHENTTEAIIGSAFEVYNVLGYGFLEKVYQKAMQVELLKRNRDAELEHAIKVQYKGTIIGEYAADLLVARNCYCRT